MPKREPTKDPEIFKIGESFFFRGSIGGERLEEKLEGLIDAKVLENVNWGKAGEKARKGTNRKRAND